jgi:uncharacterized SAM-binding protein YcdF (DUF218 family)
MFLMADLEEKWPRPAHIPSHVTGAILLGGMLEMVPTTARGDKAHPSYNMAGARLFEFVDLVRRHPQLRYVVSGGGFYHDEWPEARVIQATLQAQGIDLSRFTFEDKSRNTEENATLSHDLVKPKAGETWLLVTSAFHMGRAMHLFQQAGWNVIPYAVDYHMPPRDQVPLFNGSLVKGIMAWSHSVGEWA